MVRGVGVLVAVAALSACANIAPNMPKMLAKDYPEIGRTVTGEVGETIVEQENIGVYPAARFVRDFKVNVAAGAIGYRAGTPYLADRLINGKPAFCGQGTACGGFGNCVEDLPVCFMQGATPSSIDILGKFSTETISVPPGLIHYDQAAAVNGAGFRRHLLYTGKSGQILHLSYREFTYDLARPAFTQDLNFDLSEGRLIGFKGARFEILSATNTAITYKMLANFPDRE